MKRIALTLSLILTAARLHAFEGQVTYQLTETNGRSSTLACQVKGDRLLVTSNLLRGQGTMLVVLKGKVFYTLVPALRLAMKQPLPDVASTVGSLGAVTLTPTGKNETVAGQPCTVYTFRTDDTEGETCAAGGLDNLYRPLATSGAWPAWAKDVMKKGLFPLRADGKNKAGQTFRLAATEVQKMRVPAEAMSVPDDFRVTENVDLGSLLGGAAQP